MEIAGKNISKLYNVYNFQTETLNIVHGLELFFNNLEKNQKRGLILSPVKGFIVKTIEQAVCAVMRRAGCRLSGFYLVCKECDRRFGMHPELIRAEIRMRGKTLTDVAKAHGISPRVVGLALRQPSLSGEKAIAAFLNRSLHELFPERWTKGGKRIRPRYRYLYEGGAE